MRIGMFDSGIGGLTVLNKMLEKFPNNEYIYVGDTKNLPYGTKTKEELRKLVNETIEFLLSKKVECIIIACGTVSSSIYQEIKENYNIPIIDIITPTIKYIKENKLSNIGVIATPLTIKSEIFKNNIDNIISISCPKFVPLIENNNKMEIDNAIDEYLSPLKNKIKYLILGCTHYPLIQDEIKKYFNNNIKIINMADCITNYFKESTVDNTKIELYFTKIDENIKKNIDKIVKNNNNYQILSK